MPRPHALTEMEGTVLGVVWSRQPCTPYQVRREFLDSPSAHWSGSAGAIYPVMARLEAARLVASAAHATGSRQSRRYRVTQAGRAALRRWVGPPIPEEVLTVPPDPLRTRVAFMTILPAGDRAAFLEEIETRLATLLDLAKKSHAEARAGDPYFELMARGAVAMQKTRLVWMRAVLETLREGGLDGD